MLSNDPHGVTIAASSTARIGRVTQVADFRRGTPRAIRQHATNPGGNWLLNLPTSFGVKNAKASATFRHTDTFFYWVPT